MSAWCLCGLLLVLCHVTVRSQIVPDGFDPFNPDLDPDLFRDGVSDFNDTELEDLMIDDECGVAFNPGNNPPNPGNAGGGKRKGRVPRYSIKCQTVRENVGKVIMTVTRDQAGGVARLDFEVRAIWRNPSGAVVKQDGRVFFKKGQRVATIEIQVANDAVRERDEKHTVTIKNPAPKGVIKKGRATLIILDDD